MARKNPRQAKAEKRAKKAAKNERRASQRTHGSRQSNMLLSGLAEAEELLNDGFAEESVEILEELAHRYPRRLEVLGMLLDAYYQQHDMWSYQSVCQRLTELEPDEVDAWLSLAGAALGNGQMATAHRAFNQVLSRRPDHPEADKAREAYDGLEEILQTEMAKYGMSQADGYDLLLLHDEINLHLQQGNYERVANVAERLVARCPTFAPALNNRSEAWFRSGNLDLALADARRVLEFDADNFHALANLARYLFLSGQFDEVQAVAERLKVADSESPDLFVKQAEALGILGDWQGVLDILKQAEGRGAEGEMGLLYHLAGVAAAELGQLAEARKYWKRAAKLGSMADWPQQNLDDLKLPIGEKNGPWAFAMEYWIPRAVIERLKGELERAGSNTKGPSVRRRVRKFLEEHPYLEKIMPVLLERGDSAAREFVIRVASISRLPTIMSAVRDFAFGQRGADKLRHTAATYLVEAEAIEPGLLRMWIKDELRDVNLMSFEITAGQVYSLPEEVEELAADAWQAIHDEEGAQAEMLLDEAIKLHPNDPTLEYNRTVAVLLQGRKKEALALVRDLHARYPDYLFARIALAEEAIDNRDFETARKLLNPLMAKRRFHLSEYTALCHAHIKMLSTQGEQEGARAWLRMWEDVAPDDERLEYWSMRLNKRKLLSRFFD